LRNQNKTAPQNAGGRLSIDLQFLLASGSASNGADVAAINAEIVEFPVAHTA
jgi:hypothetical protein